MSYNISLTNGSALTSVQDGTVDITTTSLNLIGRNYAGFGTFLNENFVKLLENASSATAPTNPLVGQLWWDSNNRHLSIWQGTNWKIISSSQSGASAPANPVVGDFWWNPNGGGGGGQLSVYNGSVWIGIGPATAPGAPITSIAAYIVSDGITTHTVGNVLVNNKLLAVYSSDATSFSPATPVGGLTTINPGLNMVVGTDITTPMTITSNLSVPNISTLNVVTANNVSTQSATVYGTSAANIATANITNTSALTVSGSSNLNIVQTNSTTTTGNTATGNLAVASTLTTITLTANAVTAPYISASSVTCSTSVTAPTIGTTTLTASTLAASTSVSAPAISAATLSASTSVSTVTMSATTVNGTNYNVSGSLLPTTGGINIGSSGSPFATLYGTATSAQYADLAERFASDVTYPEGTVVELGGTQEITQVSAELSEDVLGVVSTKAAYLMNDGAGNDHTHPAVALAGRVPVRVIGTVNKNDRLVSAGNGVARAATRTEITPFNVIGRALESKSYSAEGLIEAIVRVSI